MMRREREREREMGDAHEEGSVDSEDVNDL